MARTPSRIHRAKDGNGHAIHGKLVNARVSDEAAELLRHECAARLVREACYTPVGKLITEAVLAYYGPNHKPGLLPVDASRQSPKTERPAAVAHKGAA